MNVTYKNVLKFLKVGVLFFAMLNEGAVSQVLLPDEDVVVVSRERNLVYVVNPLRGSVSSYSVPASLHHGVIKWDRYGTGWLLGRDGVLIRMDDMEAVKLGESSVGFAFVRDMVCVALYDSVSVKCVDRKNLEVRWTSPSMGRATGVDVWHDSLLIFSLMDSGMVVIAEPVEKGSMRVIAAGGTPFDGRFYGNVYIAATTEGGLLIVNPDNGHVGEWHIAKGVAEISPPYKVPHLSAWAQNNDTFYIPLWGAQALAVVHEGRVLRVIDLPGKPVFASVSRDGSYLAVNYSGGTEDTITIINLRKGRLIHINAGKRVVHIRWSNRSSALLYYTSYYENALKGILIKENGEWEIVFVGNVPSPSGIFIKPSTQKSNEKEVW